MATSRDLRTDRLAVGQLLGRLLRQFRSELLAPGAEAGFDDLREAHLRIFGNVGIDGIRLTELAARAQLSPAATSELVDDLQGLGYLERRPDPTDGRAKLIYPTRRGRRALDAAGDRVAEIEQRWADIVGRPTFDAAWRLFTHCFRPVRPKRRTHLMRRTRPTEAVEPRLSAPPACDS